MTLILNDLAHVQAGDDLDALLGELLDLQHDLADLVIWLAETWPDGLAGPKLATRYVDENTSCRVNVFTATGADLHRAAVALGVPVVTDPAPDRLGSRYARAVRQFGRVALLAMTTVNPATGEARR
jgi:hypothetical protein